MPSAESTPTPFSRCCDTLLIRDSVILTRVRFVRDTLMQVASRDSIREVPVPVEVVREVRYVPWYYRYPALIFYALLALALVALVLSLYWRITCLR